MKKKTDFEGHVAFLKKRAKKSTVFHAVILADGHVLHFTPSLSAVREMAELDFGIFILTDAQRKLKNTIDFDRDPWDYKILPNSREMVVSPPAEDIGDAVRLLREKAWSIEVIIRMIERFQRQVLHNGELPLQYEIYRAKREQAKMVLEGITDFSKTFHVHAWSSMVDLSLEESAKSILFKAEELDIDLFRIETMRLESCRAVRAAENKKQIRDIFRRFQDKAGASNA